MTTHPNLTAVAAEELRPGDIVTDDHGVRRFAAFDVDADDAGVRPRMVTVYTAVADQERGQMPTLLINAEDLLWVALPRPVPRTTTTTVAEILELLEPDPWAPKVHRQTSAGSGPYWPEPVTTGGTVYTIVATFRPGPLEAPYVELAVREALRAVDAELVPCGWAPDPDTIADHVDADHVQVIDLNPGR